jgi:hypothetical protein
MPRFGTRVPRTFRELPETSRFRTAASGAFALQSGTVVVRHFREMAFGMSAVTFTVAVMAMINEELREHLVNVFVGDRAAEIAIITAPIADLSHTALKTVTDYHGTHGPLIAFAVAAAVLLAAMFKI